MQEVMECLFQVLNDMLMQFSFVFIFRSFASPVIMQRATGGRVGAASTPNERVIADENRTGQILHSFIAQFRAEK